ncbi:DnaJ (Hsp40), sub C, member 17 [Geranomyces variabilis]|uniref:DnaJ (Hsp40), sub C, member 17 n=1 Tax=Geranomyces variabilis TaxID=109894 RepID=A0AAD5TJE1_9FUNG|nr:DnaJ (Hsp40), sub C, member 17 [Geranomyces variabilis]
MASLDEDYYGLLGLPFESSVQEINKAYRKLTLKFHPDKVGPDNKIAAHMFQLIKLASETLSDPESRAAYDALYKARISQKRKLEAMDAGLRKARTDLEAREMSAKRAKDKDTDTFLAAVQRRNEIDRLRENGLRKAQAAEEQRRQMAAAKVDEAVNEAWKARRAQVEEAASVMDCTIRVKWKPKLAAWTAPTIEAAFARYGKVDKVIINSKGKPSAMVIFESVFDAAAAMDDHLAQDFRNLLLSWAGGSRPSCLTDVPLGDPRSSAPSANQTPAPATTPVPAFAVAGSFDDDYEMITLMKMAQAAAEKAIPT